MSDISEEVMLQILAIIQCSVQDVSLNGYRVYRPVTRRLGVPRPGDRYNVH